MFHYVNIIKWTKFNFSLTDETWITDSGKI